MRDCLGSAGLDLIFRQARTHNGWASAEVAEILVREIYDLMKMGPTSANCSPARFIFITSQQGKEMLKPVLSKGNMAKTLAAPVTAIIGYDMRFYELLPELFPHAPEAKNWFSGDAGVAQETAFRNSTLQGAYLMIAARALGLDVGPMSGFDQTKLNDIFWPEGRVKVNFLCNIGIGDPGKLFERNPKLPFERVCQFL